MAENCKRQDIDSIAALTLTPETELPTITAENYPALLDAFSAGPAIAQAAAEANGVVWEDHTIDGPGGSIDVTVLKPAQLLGNSPLYLAIHSGGMIIGDRFGAINGGYDEYSWIKEHNMIIVTPEYRLAPEHPAPAGLDDCYATLEWAVEQAEEWGVNKDRIMVGGASGGGGLAAGVALMARDRGEIDLFAQCLIYPMLDARNITASSQQFAEPHGRIWPRESNEFAWNALLGEGHEEKDISPYIAPARATDLAGLPTTYIDVGSAEVFRDEDIKYALGLLEAGVQTELHVWRGGYHGYDVFGGAAPVSLETTATRSNWMQRILA
ncbi:alpha/beta hydrolase fold domain-containing protein [Corynebacterium stationis]|uniref:alpha/beta hydrolase fold domain-containing protein n=1 Tax=Corynebacterium stationis TaxID=1705 RepID=UPI0024B22475|nr:alpha/beta hydrolase fold domain-containing protein [Corynebacterium stationis]